LSGHQDVILTNIPRKRIDKLKVCPPPGFVNFDLFQVVLHASGSHRLTIVHYGVLYIH